MESVGDRMKCGEVGLRKSAKLRDVRVDYGLHLFGKTEGLIKVFRFQEFNLLFDFRLQIAEEDTECVLGRNLDEI